MKREIKFRAWGRYGNWDDEGEKQEWEMIDSDALCFEEFKPLCELLEDREDQEYFMQYTGRKDKNGIEIYEGDIVKVDNSEPEENGEFDVITQCKWDNGCFVLEDHAGGQWTRQLFHQPDRLTIIGNIFQNPELLTP